MKLYQRTNEKVVHTIKWNPFNISDCVSYLQVLKKTRAFRFVVIAGNKVTQQEKKYQKRRKYPEQHSLGRQNIVFIAESNNIW